MEKILGLNWAIANVVKTAREEKNFTQGQLAGFAGLSEIYVSSLERGCRGDSVNALMQIAKALGMSSSELMQRIEIELERGPQKPDAAVGRPRSSRS